MELNFIKCEDYHIPDISLETPNVRLGKWGLMRKAYLKQAQLIIFTDTVLAETLFEHCAEIEATTKSRMEVILPRLMKTYGVTKLLKTENQFERIRKMNACVVQARETMALIRMLFKLLIPPLILAVTIIQWVGICFSEIIFNLSARFIFLNYSYQLCYRCDSWSRSAENVDSQFCVLHHPTYR